jgi:hypothetical protein
MSQTVVNARNYWNTQTALTNLVPFPSVWVDVVGDKPSPGGTRPYVTFEQVSVKTMFVFGGNRIVWTTLKVNAYDATLASVDAIISQVEASYVEATGITPNQTGNGCLYVDLTEGVVQGGDYMATITLKLMEAF